MPQSGDGITIEDNDFTTLSFKAARYNVIEEDKAAQLTIVRTGNAEGDVSVYLDAESVTAQLNLDFILPTRLVTFKSGERSKTVTIKLVDDKIPEYRETFKVKLTSPTPHKGVFFGTSETEVVIYDKDHL